MGKQDLPKPYDQDLSQIVVRVKGATPQRRAALANSVKVASYLNAGTSLVIRNLAGTETLRDRDPKTYWSGLSFLSQRAVVMEMANNPAPFYQQGSLGQLRSTWASHHEFIDDLLAFCFSAMNYDPQYGAEIETRGSWLIDDSSFAAAIERSAYHELAAIGAMPMFRLQLIMAAIAGRDDRIRHAIADNYQGALQPWRKIYAATFAARGLRLRDGVTLDELTDILAAVTEGLAIRQLGDADAKVVDDERRRTLLSTAVAVVLLGALEPASGPRGAAIRDALDAMTRDSGKPSNSD
jgi:hypothetical protein